MSDLLEAGLGALRAGLNPLPPRSDGSKAPAFDWKERMTRMATEEEVRSWYANGSFSGLGLVCGTVSGGLEMLEFEGRARDEGLSQAFLDAADAAALGDLVDRVITGYLEETPSGGFHLLWRCEEIEGNQKLARRPATEEELAADPNDKVRVLIETRGQGGFVVVAPSAGATHPSGRAWQLLQGGFDSIATITPAERAELLRLARTFDRMPKVEEPRPAPPSRFKAGPDGVRPGDDFGERTTWAEILEPHGWRHTFTAGGNQHWRRPGKATGTSATINEDGEGVLYVFSSSTVFEPDRAYSKFGAYAVLNHGGDYRAAAKSLAVEGFGTQERRPSRHTYENGDPGPSEPEADLYDVEDQADELARMVEALSSWAPVDLADVLSGGLSRPVATMLRREDGQGLIYPAKTHSLNGEPETGKSMLAQHLCAEQIRDHHHVLYIDFEDDAYGVVERMKTLGLDDADLITFFHYVRPDEPVSEGACVEIGKIIEAFPLTVAIIDGVAEAMSMAGLNEDKSPDVTKFLTLLPRYLERAGVAVVLIDHLVKEKDGQGRYARGSGHKLGGLTGAAYKVESVKPFGRGLSGGVKLTVAKDRPGTVRPASVGGKMVASVGFISDGDTLTVTVKPAESSVDEGGRFRPTHLMESVSRCLELQSEPLSMNGVTSEVHGKREFVHQALNALVAEGYVDRSKQGQTSLHRSIRPFRESEAARVERDETSDDSESEEEF